MRGLCICSESLPTRRARERYRRRLDQAVAGGKRHGIRRYFSNGLNFIGRLGGCRRRRGVVPAGAFHSAGIFLRAIFFRWGIFLSSSGGLWMRFRAIKRLSRSIPTISKRTGTWGSCFMEAGSLRKRCEVFIGCLIWRNRRLFSSRRSRFTILIWGRDAAVDGRIINSRGGMLSAGDRAGSRSVGALYEPWHCL